MSTAAPAAILPELSNTCADGKALQDALTCLKNTHPGTTTVPGNYDHIGIRMLLRKMLPRMYGATCVRGVRVFWRAGATADDDIAAFFFVRLRAPTNPNAYCVTVGVGISVTTATITSEVQKLVTYMNGQPGGNPLILLGTINESPPSETLPVTARPNLNAAIYNARHVTNKLSYQGITAPDPKPWPNAMYWWKFQQP